MFFFKNILSFISYIATPPNKVTGPKANRWFFISLIAVMAALGIGVPTYFYAHTNNYKNRAISTLHQELEVLGFTQILFNEPVSYCRFTKRQMYCGAAIVSQGNGLDHDYARRQAQRNGWRLVAASTGTGTPTTGWLRYADYTKENQCLTLREVEGPATTQVTLALDHECPISR